MRHLFLIELTREGTWGENGYLAERGLVPLPREERDAYAKKVKELKGAGRNGAADRGEAEPAERADWRAETSLPHTGYRCTMSAAL